MSKLLLHWMLPFALLLTGCAGLKPAPTYQRERTPRPVYERPAPEPEPPSTSPARPAPEKRKDGKPTGHGSGMDPIDQAYRPWIGSPYRYGGESPNTGVDCSAYVRAVIRKAYDVKLPRTARSQFRHGNSIPRSRLEKGDLLFFNLDGRKISHVGIYLDDGKFTHASASEGVTVDDLNRRIWQTRFVGARRVRP
ncbi:hypothetical protein GF324_14380 [bacterium]|nr:hypothetical protein [bacterium]